MDFAANMIAQLSLLIAKYLQLNGQERVTPILQIATKSSVSAGTFKNTGRQ
jgi:hypothetical protein